MKITTAILFFLGGLQVLAKDYSGYKVYRFFNHDKTEGIYDVWAEGHGWVDVLLPPGQDVPAGVEHELLVDNVQDRIDHENDHRSRHSRFMIQKGITPNASQIFQDYHDYDTLISFFDSLPLKKSKEVIGQTYLGRDIYAFNFGSGKRRIVIHGGIHAREWISPAVVTWIGYWLNTQDSKAQSLLENFSWSIIPVLNVDGYDYTRTSDRLWRKNRQPNPGSHCVGIDPNRNFGFEWGTGGSSTNPCAEDFQGHNPFEVPCTAAITKYVASFPKGEVIAYFDFHSYSQLWLYPYGYNCGIKIPEFDIVDRASQIAISAIAKVSGTRYTEGPICTTIYKASGSSTDHMYAMGVPLSFGVELRDKGRHGFMLPPNQIIPTGMEMASGYFRAMSSFLIERQVAIAAVRKAAELCRKVSIKSKTIKADSSPVTVADFGSQAIINHEISKAFPNDAIVGEEDSSYVKSDHAIMKSLEELLDGFTSEQICALIDLGNDHGGPRKRFWTLDPIDGTKGFLRGGQYAICLGLIEDGIPKVSVMATPNLPFPDLGSKTLGTIFVAVRDHGAFQASLFENGEMKETPIHSGSNDNFATCKWTESFEPAHSAQNKSASILSRLGINTASIRMDSQAKYGLIARGEAHIYLRIPTKPDYEENIWDHAIGSLLVEESGGVVGDLDGNPLDFTKGRTLGKLHGIAAVNSRESFERVVEVHKELESKD